MGINALIVVTSNTPKEDLRSYRFDLDAIKTVGFSTSVRRLATPGGGGGGGGLGRDSTRFLRLAGQLTTFVSRLTLVVPTRGARSLGKRKQGQIYVQDYMS